MKQMESAVKIAEAKYPKEQGYHLFCIFDDSLNVEHMNAKEGGQQAVTYDTFYNEKVIPMSKQVRKPSGETMRFPKE